MFDEEFASVIANARADEEAFAIFSEDPDQALLLDDERNIVDSTLSELNSKLTAAGEYTDEMSPSDVEQLIAAIDNAHTHYAAARRSLHRCVCTREQVPRTNLDASYGGSLVWGGNWVDPVDEMHFEYVG